jgi:curved DNA-binding protein CbpA
MTKAKQDHYEVLGVSVSANTADLKRAYRDKARQSHPDKGGNELRMAEINYAFEVLSDPGRRLLYDKTGEDARKPFDEEVRAMLLDAFGAAMQTENDLLGRARKRLSEIKSQIEDQKRKIVSAKQALTTKRDKISTKGLNLFHMIVDRELQTTESALLVIEHSLEVHAAASRILSEYETDEVRPVKVMNMWGSAMGSTTGIFG